MSEITPSPTPPAAAATAPTARPVRSRDETETTAWQILLAAGALARLLEPSSEIAAFRWSGESLDRVEPGAPGACLAWHPGAGWQLLLPPDDPRAVIIDLWLPVASATTARPIVIAHLGQSIDGFIATPTGDSQFVTGPENILHLHRMRALCDAVIVGAGTVAFDDPQLTTRQVMGGNPVRVIFDPTRRLGPDYKVFTDRMVDTLYACAIRHLPDGDDRIGHARVVGLESPVVGAAAAELIARLRERGHARIFIEGGGVTVSAFLEAGLLDRLQIAVAPVIIGNGRPAIRLPAPEALRDCARPSYRVFRMGGDVLFDCDLRHAAGPIQPAAADARLVRVI